LAYAVVEKDGSISQGSVGISNIETGAPVQSEMLFRPGSTTKMMVAAALLQVMHARKMSRSTTVGTIAPQAHASLRQLTVHQLLSMTAPLTNGEEDNGPLEETALAERVKSGTDLTVFDKRDTIFSYSNGAYDLAGHILEQLVGKPFPDAMKEVLFTPAGMTRSFYRPLEAATYSFSQGHHLITPDKVGVVRPWTDNAVERPSGTLFTNVVDVARFVLLLRNEGVSSGGGRVLAPEVVRSMLRTYVDLPSSALGAGYGYGIFGYRAAGRQLWYHSGSMTGFMSDVLMVPSEKLAIIVMTNGPDTNLRPDVLSMIYKDRTGQPLLVDPWGAYAAWTGEFRGYDPVPRQFANALLGQWGQPLGDPPLHIKQEGNELAIHAGKQRLGLLRWVGGNRLVRLSAGQRPVAISLTCGRDGHPDYLTNRLFALPRLSQSVKQAPRCLTPL
jgi:CubicO group peptidase (beta-lactamase class C family)